MTALPIDAPGDVTSHSVPQHAQREYRTESEGKAQLKAMGHTHTLSRRYSRTHSHSLQAQLKAIGHTRAVLALLLACVLLSTPVCYALSTANSREHGQDARKDARLKGKAKGRQNETVRRKVQGA